MMNNISTPTDQPEPPTPSALLPEPDSPATTPRTRLDSTPVRQVVAMLAVVTLTFAVTATSGSIRSVGTALALAVLFAAAARSGARDRRARVLTGAGVLLLPWLAIRHSPWLIAVDLAVATALLLTAASVRPGQLIASRCTALVASWLGSVLAGLYGHRLVATGLSAAASGSKIERGQARAVLRATLAAASIMAVAIVVLASGDALFASYLDMGGLWASMGGRLLAALVGAVCFSGVVGMFRSAETAAPKLRSVHPTTLLVTMAGLVAVIGAYGLVQIAAVMSGAEYVERRTGLTYAEYARSGFFQVVVVTCITVSVLTAVRSARSDHHPDRKRTFIVLAALLTIAVVSLVVTSVVKLVLYADRLGLTMLRVYTITFAVWLGLVALLTFVALVRSTDRWLTPVVLSSMVVGAFAMNVVNPERLVAEHNIDRAREGAELDLHYLQRLSADAVPTILAGLSDLGQRPVDSLWCGEIEQGGGFASNRSVSAAAAARAVFCEPG